MTVPVRHLHRCAEHGAWTCADADCFDQCRECEADLAGEYQTRGGSVDIKQTFPSKFLKSSDLNGATPTVTIDHVDIEEVGKDREKLPVVYFVGKQKGIVLNKTNANAITKIAGTSETDDWPGIKVQLFTAEVSFGTEMVEAIRIRAPRQPQPVPAPKPKPAPVVTEDDFTSDDDNSEVPF